MTLKSGTRLGPYEIVSPLGAGGMGEVYRARDTRLGRDVAVKVLPQHLATSAEDRARFAREAKTISALNHPHICTLHDIGREGDTDYLVMELVEGETLVRRIRRGPLPTAEVLRIGIQIADALDRAHRAGMVHRDLKPANVMLTNSRAKLMDFGLAREARVGGAGSDAVTTTEPVAGGRSDDSITKRGTIVGTHQYMAPEQLEGKPADARSDLWALGCVLYEMATGKRAFEGTSPVSVISAIMRGEPRAMTELAPLTPPAFERAVRQCLAKDADDRWQTAGDLRRELSWIAGTGGQAPVPAAVAARRRTRERIAWVASTVAVLTALVLGGLWTRAREPRERHLKFRPLTFKPMLIYKAAFAPDGKTILLSAGVGGLTPRIYVIRPEFPEPQAISDPGTHLLSVSSTGELAVLTRAKMPRGPGDFVGTLARMPLGGGAPREILDGVREADWSPDGSQLAVLRRVGGKDRIEYPIGHVLCDSIEYPSDIRVSPKGDAIAYLHHSNRHDPGGSVDRLDLDGRNHVLSSGYRTEAGVAWSSDGREIFFAGAIGGRERQGIFRVSTGGKQTYAFGSAGDITVQDVSREGRWLVVRHDSRSALMVHKPEWKQDHDLSWLDASEWGRLSNDGKVLAFSEYSDAVGDLPIVCLRNTDGSPVVKLGVGRPCDFTKDGKSVLAVVPSSPPYLVLYPIGAGEARRIPQGPIQSVTIAQLSPDGDSVAIFGNLPGKGDQVFLQSLSGGGRRAITPEGTLFAQLSPDWKSVAADGFSWPWMDFPLNGEKSRPMPTLTSHDMPLEWRRDGRAMVVLDREDPLGHLRLVDLQTGRRTPYLEADPSPPNRDGLVHCRLEARTPDGRCYAYTAYYTISALYLAEAKE